MSPGISAKVKWFSLFLIAPCFPFCVVFCIMVLCCCFFPSVELIYNFACCVAPLCLYLWRLKIVFFVVVHDCMFLHWLRPFILFALYKHSVTLFNIWTSFVTMSHSQIKFITLHVLRLSFFPKLNLCRRSWQKQYWRSPSAALSPNWATPAPRRTRRPQIKATDRMTMVQVFLFH